MAISVGNSHNNLGLVLARREKALNEKSAQANQPGVSFDGDNQDLEDLSVGARLQRFAQASDEMSAAAAGLRNRREFEKKTGSAGESGFDRVLEEDVRPKVDKLVQVIKISEGGSVSNLLQQMRALFPDDSDLVLVLREILRRRTLSEAVRKRLQTLLAHVEKEADPKRLKAGINVALKARLMGKTLKMSPGMLRESYRDFLTDDDTEIEQYQVWIGSYGIQNRGIVTDFMEDALLADIDAADPSCSHMEFYVLQSRIGQIKRIRSSDIVFVQGLLANNATQHIDSKEETWLLLMFGLLEQTAELNTLLSQTIGECLRFVSSKVRANLLQTIYWHGRKLPVEVFSSSEERERMLASFETLLSTALHYENIEQRKAST